MIWLLKETCMLGRVFYTINFRPLLLLFSLPHLLCSTPEHYLSRTYLFYSDTTCKTKIGKHLLFAGTTTITTMSTLQQHGQHPIQAQTPAPQQGQIQQVSDWASGRVSCMHIFLIVDLVSV